MATAERIQDPGYHHVITRATGGGSYFVDDDDRRLFVVLLERTARQLDWQIHAYCLMTTHYHAVTETQHSNLSRGMQRINSRYVREFNGRWARFRLAGRHTIHVTPDRRRRLFLRGLPLRLHEPGERRPVREAGGLAVERRTG